jgi:predicted nucleic acid-binding protein
MSDSAIPRIVWQLERVARELQVLLDAAAVELAAVRAAELLAGPLESVDLRQRKQFLLGQIEGFEAAILNLHSRRDAYVREHPNGRRLVRPPGGQPSDPTSGV